MIVLSDSEVREAVSYKEIIEAVEEALLIYEEGSFYMPERMHADYKGNTLLLMPSFTDEYFGTKLVSIFPENPEKGIPSLQGVFVLNDGNTGAPLALMNAAKLTALRTAGVGALSTKYLTDMSIKNIGIIGAGVQGFHQALFSTEIRSIEKIFVFDKNKETVKKFSEELKKLKPTVEIISAENSEEVLINSDVIITATTSLTPVLPDKPELFSGKHFIGIGSYKPEMREYPSALYKKVEAVFIDTKTAIKESGDISFAIKEGLIGESKIRTLGDYIKKGEKERFSTTFFKSVGMALFDLVVGSLIYEKALDKGLGKKVNLG